MSVKEALIQRWPEVLGADQIHSFEKPMLAFDALSKLTKQFAYDPDFNRLLEIILLSLSGQFSAPNTFALIFSQDSNGPRTSYHATGAFNKNETLANLVLSGQFKSFIEGCSEPINIEEFCQSHSLDNITNAINKFGILLVAPLWHKDKLIGLLGLGPKANKRPFDKDEFALFAALIHSIVPLIANSLLFTEISGLNTWYIDILDNIQQGIFVFDAGDKLLNINKAALEIVNYFGHEQYSMESIKGKSLARLFSDDAFQGWSQRLLNSKNGTGREIVEKLVAGAAENQRLYNARISFTYDRSNSGQDLIIAVEDITTQKENELRFFELEKLAEKGFMASSISHELNNYLGLMVGGVELTQLLMGKGDAQKALANLEKLRTNLDKMERFVKGLLDYGALNPIKSWVNLNSVVSDALLFVTIQKKFNSIRVEVDCYSKLPDLEMDVDQISQLILNLLNNAADAINETGKSLGHIAVRTVLCDNEIILSIKDDGLGIKPENKEKLFKARFTTKKDGHGFGLATCAKIVKNHNGSINIESELGIGTTFKICFPLGENTSGQAV